MGSLVLSWVVLPILQGMVESGEFGVLERLIDSLCLNAILYTGLTLVVLVTVWVYRHVQPKPASTMTLLLALTNVVGLVFVIAFLGRGIVDVPRRLWRRADRPSKRLHRLLFKMPGLFEEKLEAEAALAETVSDVWSLSVPEELQANLAQLLECAPFAHDDGTSQTHTVNSKRDLVRLNVKLKEAISRYEQSQVAWEHAVSAAVKLTASTEQHDRPCARSRLLAVLAAIMSALIMVSEICLTIKGHDYGPISQMMHRWPAPLVDILASMIFGYMAYACYSSFLQLRILHWYRLLPNQHTDLKSVVLFAAMFCRFIFPLGYNYLALVEGGGDGRILLTQFSRVMGGMDLVPLVGRAFAIYVVPVSLLVVAGCVLVRIDRSFYRLVGLTAPF
jgi:hypothetical protein